MTFYGMVMNLGYQNRCLECLLPFMRRQHILGRFQFFNQNISYIQRKLRNALANKVGKLEVLQNYWEKVLIELQNSSSLKKKDKKMNELCGHIMLVPKFI